MAKLKSARPEEDHRIKRRVFLDRLNRIAFQISLLYLSPLLSFLMRLPEPSLIAALS